MKKIVYFYLFVFVLMFLHSETDLFKVEGDFCHDHDICNVIKQSNIPTSQQQISEHYIIDNSFVSNIPLIDISFIRFFHRTNFINNPLSEFLKDNLIHLFKKLQI